MVLSELKPEGRPEATGIPSPFIDFLMANSGQMIQSIVFINNIPNDKFHIRLISETGSDDGFTEGDFKNALGWFEQRMQKLTRTKEEVKISESGTEWQLRQTQRLRQNRRALRINILHKGISTADILQMTEIAATLGGIKNQLPRNI